MHKAAAPLLLLISWSVTSLIYMTRGSHLHGRRSYVSKVMRLCCISLLSASTPAEELFTAALRVVPYRKADWINQGIMVNSDCVCKIHV